MMVDLAGDELDRVYERIGHKQARAVPAALAIACLPRPRSPRGQRTGRAYRATPQLILACEGIRRDRSADRPRDPAA
jgi:hypothetical protein